MRKTLLAVVLVSIVLSGCTTFSDTDSDSTATPLTTPDSNQTTPSESATSAALLASGSACTDGLQVGFWGLMEPKFWGQDRIRITAEVPANMSVLFVVYVDDSISGVSAEQTQEKPVAIDGGTIELDEPRAGEHTVTVVVFNDTNDNQRLDRDVDEPCKNGGGIVQTMPERINFTRFS
ncbi:PQQ-binding-like beta-propeller repeat protein [Haloarcula salina]|uniref:Uncharacterized protein n=1 Tax=Haloarcula salina TaxID=1429914 RepID=A0AA41KG92_9EURY|nr:hypothetical protein [Haloarcula salina]MBV0900446.1 hypothetical protein [Haloarcula salina]